MAARSCIVFILAAGIAVACASAGCADSEIRPEDYSRSCDANADCAFAYFGDACAGCFADLKPVNADELEDIGADADAARATCAPWSERNYVDCVVPVPSVRPVCNDGTCVEGPADGEPCDFGDDGVCRGSDE